MRRQILSCLMVLATLAGCATRLVDFVPDEEAIYDQPMEEVWPRVRDYFHANGFAFRETPGAAALQTEWREEFMNSRVAAYWHRYLVVGRPDGPHRSKLVITRETRSVNSALRAPGSDLLWTVDGRTPDNPSGLGSATSILLAQQQADESAVIVGQSQQSARDLSLEWRVFRRIAPELSAHAAKSQQSPDVEVLSDASIECGVPVLGLGKLARAGNVVLLGELHGTQQVPHFVAQSACQVATQGIPVTVGLEIPDGNQARLDAFVGSAGQEADWAKLMESPFWRSPLPDGRNSEAVVYLLDALRRLRAQGLDVKVFAYDHPPLKGAEREEAMAARVLEVMRSSTQRALLVVSGNLHPRQVKGLPWDEDFRPMGLRVAEKGAGRVYSLDVAYKSGTAWICAVGADQKLDCGVKQARGHDSGERYFVQLFNGRNAEGYNGIFYVGAVSASPPAVYQGVEPAGQGGAAASGD